MCGHWRPTFNTAVTVRPHTSNSKLFFSLHFGIKSYVSGERISVKKNKNTKWSEEKKSITIKLFFTLLMFQVEFSLEGNSILLHHEFYLIVMSIIYISYDNIVHSKLIAGIWKVKQVKVKLESLLPLPNQLSPVQTKQIQPDCCTILLWSKRRTMMWHLGMAMTARYQG